MTYDFDQVIDRSNNHAAKYDERMQKFGTEDVIPLWIADMDGFTQVKAFVLDSAETLRPISDKTYTGTSTPLPQ